jgi:hypothetical protein
LREQKIYKADGDAHSWEWLAMVSPCVDVLRSLANRINADLGAAQGKKHTVPDLKKDIDTLMESLKKHEVYVVKEGRVLDSDEMPVPDVISVGFASLTHGSTSTPLGDFNAQFNKVRDRRRLMPISRLIQRLDRLGAASPSGTAATPLTDPTALATSTVSTTVPEPSAALSDDAAMYDATNGDGSDSGKEGESDGDEDEREDNNEFSLGGPTLSRDDEDDVVFDMDTVVGVMQTEDYYWEEMLSSEMDSESEGSDQAGWASS